MGGARARRGALARRARVLSQPTADEPDQGKVDWQKPDGTAANKNVSAAERESDDDMDLGGHSPGAPTARAPASRAPTLSGAGCTEALARFAAHQSALQAEDPGRRWAPPYTVGAHHWEAGLVGNMELAADGTLRPVRCAPPPARAPLPAARRGPRSHASS